MLDMEHESDNTRTGYFAIMWDCHGLEAVARVPDPADTTFALLKGEKPPGPPNIEHWKLRARFNSQRHYEIYLITAQPGIDIEDIRSMFEASPQTAADTIRRIGQCYHSDRVDKKQAVIV
jgi:hypothetical protein